MDLGHFGDGLAYMVIYFSLESLFGDALTCGDMFVCFVRKHTYFIGVLGKDWSWRRGPPWGAAASGPG